jgi:hypothetical protein
VAIGCGPYSRQEVEELPASSHLSRSLLFVSISLLHGRYEIVKRTALNIPGGLGASRGAVVLGEESWKYLNAQSEYDAKVAQVWGA